MRIWPKDIHVRGAGQPGGWTSFLLALTPARWGHLEISTSRKYYCLGYQSWGSTAARESLSPVKPIDLAAHLGAVWPEHISPISTLRRGDVTLHPHPHPQGPGWQKKRVHPVSEILQPTVKARLQS